MAKALKMKIFGRVQGVFFRAETEKIARKLNLRGYVKNLPDETVEIMAEGEESNLKEFIKWAKHGPELAKVEKVEIDWVNITGNFPTFKVE